MADEHRKRILVIEDEEALCRLLTWQLEFAGFEVHAKTRGKAGLAYAAEHPVDLVVLDLMLPDMHGYDVCRELRKLHHPWVLPVLVLTAMAKPIDQLRGFAHGADAYLTKPFEAEHLLTAVGQLVGQEAKA